jgi:hypothetical protein
MTPGEGTEPIRGTCIGACAAMLLSWLLTLVQPPVDLQLIRFSISVPAAEKTSLSLSLSLHIWISVSFSHSPSYEAPVICNTPAIGNLGMREQDTTSPQLPMPIETVRVLCWDNFMHI